MIVLVVVLWLSNGEVISRHDVVPPNVICEVQARHIQEELSKMEAVVTARAVCVHRRRGV